MLQLTINEALNLAIQHRQNGRLPEAEQLYRQILAQQPENAPAMHHLGAIATQVGRADIGVALIRRSVAVAPNQPDAHFNLALACRALGQLDEAIAAYRQAIFLGPDFAEAHNNLADALNEKGQFDEAIVACHQAISLRPIFPELHLNLGNALNAKGQSTEAIAAYRTAINLKPTYAEAYHNLGIALKDNRQLDEAINAYQKAIDLRPGYIEAHKRLGNVLQTKGNFDEAVAAYQCALRLSPNCAETNHNLGIAFKAMGQLDDAITAYRRAIFLRPDFAETHSNLGAALKEKGDVDEAITACRRAIALDAGLPEAHLNLGNALQEKGEFDEAISAYQRSIALRPEYAEAHFNLAIALKEIGRLDEAIFACHRAITLRPDFPDAYLQLGNTLKDMSQHDDAVAAYRKAIALKPDFADAHSNLLLALHYHPNIGAQAIFEEHCAWNRQHAEPLKKFIVPIWVDRDPERRLKIGYVSPDFKKHAVAPAVLPLLASHDHEKFEIFCYAEVQKPDAMTARFRACADQWRSTAGLSDEQVANLIRQDQIDILVDLAGHTAGGRLLVFARKPAPIQVNRQGYPNTTGLTAIDYRMTDAYADPPGLSDTLHSEQLIRLPKTNWIYQPPEKSPTPDHRMVDGQITFGCFNNFAKVTDPMLMLWGRILKAVPASRLLLKAAALGHAGVRERVRELFIKEEIDAARVALRGHEPQLDGHLALYNQVDIALDPFPYHGTSTTYDALWMGVPLITLAGRTHVSRVGVSLLMNMGLPELIAENPDDYVNIAAELANDRPRLRNLRSTLRGRMEQSPLMDGPGFARNIESAYRQMWRKWCETATDCES